MCSVYDSVGIMISVMPPHLCEHSAKRTCSISRTTEPKLRHKSKKSEIFGPNVADKYALAVTKIWVWAVILGRVLLAHPYYASFHHALYFKRVISCRFTDFFKAATYSYTCLH